jgi:hypothetical protein
LALAACLGSAVLAGQAGAQVVVFDTFDDGSRTNDPGDPLDIAWFSANGSTSAPVNPEDPPSRAKPELTILDDTPTGGAGLDSGNAMFVEAVGIGSEYVGIFPSQITLGSNIGDKLELSFDWRVWAQGDGSPTTNANTPDPFPFAAELRFGLYNDTDLQLDRVGGGLNPWGNADCLCDGDPVAHGSAAGDRGVMGRMGISSSTSGPVADTLLSNIRINQEGGTQGRVLGGNDLDYIAQPLDADENGVADNWPIISTTDKYTIKLILERVEVVNTDGDNILYTMEIYDSLGVLLDSFGDTDAVDAAPLPDNNVPQTDSFDYLILVDTTGNFDSVIDNVKVELIAGSTPIIGDLNGDGFVGIGDLNIVLGNWNQNVAAGDPLLGDPSGDGFVGIADLNIVLGNWNAGTPPAANAIPEPATLALLGLGGPALLRRRGA